MTVSPSIPPIKTFERTRPIFVIGIGSPHGDDRAGWEVIDRLTSARNQKSLPASGIEPEALADFLRCGSASASGSIGKSVVLHKASVPHDVLDWLDVEAQTHIIDASYDTFADVRRYAITQDTSGKLLLTALGSLGTTNAGIAPESLRSSSTHQLDLLSTLELSATLGTLPHELFLWTVSIASVASVAKNGDMSEETQNHIERCVLAIAKELCHA